MCTTAVPATAAEALAMLESAAGMQQSALGFLAAEDVASLPAQAVADRLRALERHDAIEAAVRGRLLEVFDAQDGHLADGQRTTRTWLVHSQPGHQGPGRRAPGGPGAGPQPPRPARGAGRGLGAHQVRWPCSWPGGPGPSRRSTGPRPRRSWSPPPGPGWTCAALAAICAEIRARTAQPDPDDDDDPRLDRGLSLDTTFEGAGVIHGDLTPECAAMVQAVLDALSAPQGGGDLRTRPQRYHDALAEAMRRLLASDLLPRRAGQPVKALVHIYFAELRERDHDGILQDKWIAEYRARWAAHRAANSVSHRRRRRVARRRRRPRGRRRRDDHPRGHRRHRPGRGRGPDRPLRPVPPAPHPARTRSPGAPDPVGTLVPDDTGTQDCTTSHDASETNAAVPAGLASTAARRAEVTAAVADALAAMEHQILGKILQVVSGPGGAASFLRRHLLGKPLAGPSLPLDVGQTDDIPLHLRRLVALRDQTLPVRRRLRPARRPACEPHHVTAPRRRRPHQPHQPQRLLLVAPPRGPARTRLDPHRPPRRHQPGPKPRRQDHPQPQPATAPRVTTPALRRASLPRRSRGAVASVPCRRRPGRGSVVARASTAR